MNWTEYTLGELLSYEQPTNYIVESTKYNDKFLTPVLTAGKTFILGYTNEKDGIYSDLPVIIFDDFTTASRYVNFPFKVKSSAMKILTPNIELVIPKFIYYRMQAIQFDSSTHKRYWIQQYSKIKVAVPPILVQEQIVSRIEELFSKLDKGVETLQTIKQQLAVYRQAVLTEAFEGIENTVELGSIASIVDPHPSHRTPVEVIGGVPYIGVGDIDYVHHVIDFSSARKVSNDILQDHLSRYTLHDGDFIMGKIGTIGKPFIIALPQNYTLSANVILIQPNKKVVIPKYLFWQVSSSQITKQLLEGSTSTTQPAFGIKKARLLSIKICSLEEQNRIVQKIESHLSLCDDIGQSVTAALSQAEAMRQSILKQAFEGKL